MLISGIGFTLVPDFGPIAQLAERPVDNGEVSRSSRLRPTSFRYFVTSSGFAFKKRRLSEEAFSVDELKANVIQF